MVHSTDAALHPKASKSLAVDHLRPACHPVL